MISNLYVHVEPFQAYKLGRGAIEQLHDCTTIRIFSLFSIWKSYFDFVEMVSSELTTSPPLPPLPPPG